MELRDLLTELYGRIPGHVREAVEGLSVDQLVTEPEPGANTIGWLVWHLTRVQDDHIAEVVNLPQIWVTGGWHQRFGLDAGTLETGYGHSRRQMARVRPDSADALIEYYDAVAARTGEFLADLSASDLDRIVDEQWDPPVTLGVRLVSVADDDIQHAGQAKYVRGLLSRR